MATPVPTISITENAWVDKRNAVDTGTGSLETNVVYVIRANYPQDELMFAVSPDGLGAYWFDSFPEAVREMGF